MKAGAITHIGKLGDQFTVEEGQACAKVCAINLINQVCLLSMHQSSSLLLDIVRRSAVARLACCLVQAVLILIGQPSFMCLR